MINIDPKSWHARLYLWYLRKSGSMYAHRALQGTYLCPYMRTLLVWLPLFVVLGLPIKLTLWALYYTFWGKGDWRVRPRWVWLGLLIGAPMLIPPAWQYQGGWAWWSGAAWGFGFMYVMIVISIMVAILFLLLITGLASLIELRGGKQGIYRDIRTMKGAAKVIASPVTRPTYGFARLLYKYGQAIHARACPRVQFMQPEAWEEE